MADASSLLFNDTRCCIFDKHDASIFRRLQDTIDTELRSIIFGPSFKQPLQVFARPAQLVANPNATIGVSKKYQEAFGDIWGSGQNAQALATRPMHETIHISHQSIVNLEPIRAPA
jgi:hypothetical protein